MTNEQSVYAICASAAAAVLTVLILSLTYLQMREYKYAFENGYEQQQVPGGSRVIWVKAPVSATIAR